MNSLPFHSLLLTSLASFHLFTGLQTSWKGIPVSGFLFRSLSMYLGEFCTNRYKYTLWGVIYIILWCTLVLTINSSGRRAYDHYNLHCFSSLVLRQAGEDRLYYLAFLDPWLVFPSHLDSMQLPLSAALNEGYCGVRTIYYHHWDPQTWTSAFICWWL